MMNCEKCPQYDKEHPVLFELQELGTIFVVGIPCKAGGGLICSPKAGGCRGDPDKPPEGTQTLDTYMVIQK